MRNGLLTQHEDLLQHLPFTPSLLSTKEKASSDDIVVEMKSSKSEEVVLLQGVNGEKKTSSNQVLHPKHLNTRQGRNKTQQANVVI